MAIFGDKNQHKKVRRDIYKFMMKNVVYWESKFPAIERM
jgi:hypothetical protein